MSSRRRSPRLTLADVKAADLWIGTHPREFRDARPMAAWLGNCPNCGGAVVVEEFDVPGQRVLMMFDAGVVIAGDLPALVFHWCGERGHGEGVSLS